MWRRGGGEVPGFCVEIDLSHSAEKICRGTLLCFTDFLASKKFLEERGRGGVSGVSVEMFLSHFAEKFRRGTHLCFNLFGYREFFCFRGLCHGFLSKTFCLTMTKKIVGEPFFVSQPFWLQKKLWRGGVGSIKIFRRD